MNNENGETPKVESAESARTDVTAADAEPNRAAEKEKRVATYFFPNVLIAVSAVFLFLLSGFTIVFLIAASFSIAGIIFASNSGDSDGKEAIGKARMARILFWIAFLFLIPPLMILILFSDFVILRN